MSKALITEYYTHLSNKDLDKLGSLLSNSVELITPTVKTDGKTAVIAGYTELFDAVSVISVVSTRMYEDGNTVISETDFSLDGVTTQFAEIFTITDGLISSIHTYKN